MLMNKISGKIDYLCAKIYIILLQSVFLKWDKYIIKSVSGETDASKILMVNISLFPEKLHALFSSYSLDVYGFHL